MFKDNFQKYRTKANLTIEQLAEKMRVSKRKIIKWENGKSTPSKNQLDQLCHTLDILESNLMDEKELGFFYIKHKRNKKIIKLLSTISFCVLGLVILYSIIAFILNDYKYGLIIEDSKYIVLKPEKSRFDAGEKIEIKTIIHDNLDIELYLNDEIIRTRTYSVEDKKEFWNYEFTMPKEDSNITILTKEKKIIKIKDISTNEEVTHYYADDINGPYSSATLNDEEIEMFKDMYSKLLTTEAYQNVYCNCKAKFSLNYRYNHNENGKIINCFYKIAYHEHGIIVYNHAGYFQVIENDVFNRQLVLDMLGLFYVLEDDYIVPEYDSLKADALENHYYKSQNWPNDFGFGNLEARICGSVNSYDEAIKDFNNKSYNKNYKIEYSLKEETDFYYLINAKQTTLKTGDIYEFLIMYYKNSVYNYDDGIILTNDTNVIKKILDNNFYINNYQIIGTKSFYSQLIDKGDHYLYVNYYANCTFGDWDLSDVICYHRMTIIITKDGEIGKIKNKLIDMSYGQYD